MSIASPARVRRPPATPARRPRLGVVVGVALLAVAVAVLVSIGVGSNPLTPAQVVDGLQGRGGESTDVVRGIRIPRTLLAILVGAGLGLAGAIMQSLTRNPLGDPGILGVNAGASAAVVTGITLIGANSPQQYVWLALAGAGVAMVVVYLLGSSRTGTADPVRMALGGTAIGAVLSAYVSGQMLLHPSEFSDFRYWEIGSLGGRDLAVVADVAWFLLAGIALALLLAPALNALALGDETGVALGVRVQRIRLAGVLAIMLLCGTATAAAGPIGFVGLAVPHLARMVIGPDHRAVLPVSMLLGALLLLCADITGRLVAWPSEVGAGVVTAVVGAPFLVYLVRRRRVGRL